MGLVVRHIAADSVTDPVSWDKVEHSGARPLLFFSSRLACVPHTLGHALTKVSRAGVQISG